MSSTSAHNRSHNQGRQDRSYTSAQLAAVQRVKKCKVTDYYGILDIESPSSDSEIRKSYRKLALIMHPDKNGAPGADEAFKMVSKAFQILSDMDKKRIYDQTGSDPESRGASAADAASAFSGMRGAGGGGPGGFGGGPMFGGGDVSAEDIFNMFFNGMAGGGGTGGFQFGNINTAFGGGPTFSFGGGYPGGTTYARRRRAGGGAGAQRGASGTQANGEREEPFSLSNLIQLLPLVFLMLMPLLMSLFSDSTSKTSVRPQFVFESVHPYTEQRFTPTYHVPFYVQKDHSEKLSKRGLQKLDNQAEMTYVRQMNAQCSIEEEAKQQAIQDSKGWFFLDQVKYETAKQMQTPSCDILKQLGIKYNRNIL